MITERSDGVVFEGAVSQVWELRGRRGNEEERATGRNDSVMLYEASPTSGFGSIAVRDVKVEVKTNLLIW